MAGRAGDHRPKIRMAPRVTVGGESLSRKGLRQMGVRFMTQAA